MTPNSIITNRVQYVLNLKVTRQNKQIKQRKICPPSDMSMSKSNEKDNNLNKIALSQKEINTSVPSGSLVEIINQDQFN